MNRVMRENVIKYYESSRTHYTTYHNHKELSAWAGLILFVFFAGFINLMKLPVGFEVDAAITITVFVLIVSVLVFRYISNQLEMKDLGGAYVAASIAFTTDLITGNITDEELDEYMKVEESPDVQAQSRHVLPYKFLKKAKVLNSRGRGFQDTTKHMIYGILFIVSLLLVASKWGQVIA